MTARGALVSIALPLSAIACGARTDLADTSGAGGSVAMTEASSSLSVASSASASASSATSGASTSESASSGVVFVQCGCPDDPGYVDCAAPLDCCACNDDGLGWTVDRCEDPARFNCSCGDPLSCLGE